MSGMPPGAAVIVDTNVVVAGLLTANDTSPVARILDGTLAAAFPFVLSAALLAEYHTVLVRPKLRKLHGLNVAEVETILTDLAQNAIVLAPPPSTAPPAPDPGDQRDDLLLVTGDKRLLEDAVMGVRVFAPQVFLVAYESP